MSDDTWEEEGGTVTTLDNILGKAGEVSRLGGGCSMIYLKYII